MRLKQISFSLGTLIMTIAAAGGVFSPAGEYNDVVRSLLAVGVVLGATYVVRWWVLPPRRRTEAIMLVAGTDVIIALACMSHPDPALGIAGTSVFLVVSMLAAFYCAPAVHALHAVFAAIVMCAIVIRMADEPGPGTWRWRCRRALPRLLSCCSCSRWRSSCSGVWGATPWSHNMIR